MKSKSPVTRTPAGRVRVLVLEPAAAGLTRGSAEWMSLAAARRSPSSRARVLARSARKTRRPNTVSIAVSRRPVAVRAAGGR